MAGKRPIHVDVDAAPQEDELEQVSGMVFMVKVTIHHEKWFFSL